MGSLPVTANSPADAQLARDLPRTTRNRFDRRYLPALILAADLIFYRLRLLLTPLPLQDFMTYWISGRLFRAGADPYAAGPIFAVERALGWSLAKPLIVIAPPTILPFSALTSLFPFQLAHYLWLILSLLLEAISTVALWRYFGGDRQRPWFPLLLLATFLTAGSAEHMGQVTPLMLAALTAFLFALRQNRYLLAGALLLPLSWKFHLVYLVLLAIVLWAIEQRRWTLLLGAFATIAGTTTGVMVFNPTTLGYFHSVSGFAIDTSCGVGGVLRQLFGLEHTWLQFVPVIPGIAWFVFYWHRHHRSWSWPERLPLLLLVSVSSSPYCWAHDFVLVLPAVIALTVTLARTETDWLIPTACYTLVHFAIAQCSLLSAAWMATASLLWLVFYVVGVHALTQTQRSPSRAAERETSGCLPA